MICGIKLRNERTIAQGVAECWVYGVNVVVVRVQVDECARMVYMYL
jgi:hypothetical protein